MLRWEHVLEWWHRRRQAKIVDTIVEAILTDVKVATATTALDDPIDATHSTSIGGLPVDERQLDVEAVRSFATLALLADRLAPANAYSDPRDPVQHSPGDGAGQYL